MQERRRRYRVRIHVESSEPHTHVPYCVELDFGALLTAERAAGAFDRHSVLVKSADPDTGELDDVHYNLSPSFLWSSRGEVNWLIEDTRTTEYIVLYDTDEGGPFPPREYVGLVGNGDCLRYNDGKLHPLYVGMHANAVAVDWDGDGLTDIISPQIYGHEPGIPWFCVKFYRNEGTNDNPIFGEGVPLRALQDGRYSFIKCGANIELADWNGNGLMDMIVYEYHNPERELCIYLNTGERDEMGLPMLELAHRPKLPEAVHPFYFRVVDWYGDGRRSIVEASATAEQVTIHDPLWFPATEEEKLQADWPRLRAVSRYMLHENLSEPYEPPVFARPLPLKTSDGKEIGGAPVEGNLDIADWDDDGTFDLLLQVPGGYEKGFEDGYNTIRFFKNVGTPKQPIFEDRGVVDALRARSNITLRRVTTDAFDGVLVSDDHSGRIHYFALTGRDASGLPILEDNGFLMQRNAWVSPPSGFSRGDVCDWDGDGDWDLITGCERGFITTSENVGTQKKPVFTEMRILKQGGKAIRLSNGAFDYPGNMIEGVLGQGAVMYLDWNNSGTMDMVAAICSRLLLYKNTGTSSDPVFADPVEITASGETVAAGKASRQQKLKRYGNKPILIDWNGDGLIDVIGDSQDDRRLYYRQRYRDGAAGELRLKPPVALKYEDGTEIVPAEWHRYSKNYSAGDWNDRGVYDLFLSTCDEILRLENAGTNENPVFKRPVRLAVDGKPIIIGHHVSMPMIVDWDKRGKKDIVASSDSGLFHLFRRNYLDEVHKRITYQLER